MVGTCWNSVWKIFQFKTKHDPCPLLSTISTVQHNFSLQNASPRKGGSTWQSCRPWICTLLRRLGGWSLNVSTAPAAGKSKRSSCSAGRVSKPPPKSQRKLIDFGTLFFLNRKLINLYTLTLTFQKWIPYSYGCYGVSKWVWEKRAFKRNLWSVHARVLVPLMVCSVASCSKTENLTSTPRVEPQHSTWASTAKGV